MKCITLTFGFVLLNALCRSFAAVAMPSPSTLNSAKTNPATPQLFMSQPAPDEAPKNQRVYIGTFVALDVNMRFSVASLVDRFADYENRSRAWSQEFQRTGGKVTDSVLSGSAPNSPELQQSRQQMQSWIKQTEANALNIAAIKKVPFSYADTDELYMGFAYESKFTMDLAKAGLKTGSSNTSFTSEPLNDSQLERIKDAHEELQQLLLMLDRASSSLDIQRESLHRSKRIVGIPSPLRYPTALSAASIAAERAYLAQVNPKFKNVAQRLLRVQAAWEGWVNQKNNHNTTDTEQTANLATIKNLLPQSQELAAAAKQLASTSQVPYFYKDIDAGFVSVSMKLHGFPSSVAYLSSFFKDAPFNKDFLENQTQSLDETVGILDRASSALKTREFILNSKRTYVVG